MFGIAEAIATISAAMQAIDLYAKYGGTRAQVIQTLNPEYRPQKYERIEESVLARIPPSLTRESYAALFNATEGRVKACINGFTAAINENVVPFREASRQ